MAQSRHTTKSVNQYSCLDLALKILHVPPSLFIEDATSRLAKIKSDSDWLAGGPAGNMMLVG
jgi:hypothetical protein